MWNFGSSRFSWLLSDQASSDSGAFSQVGLLYIYITPSFLRCFLWAQHNASKLWVWSCHWLMDRSMRKCTCPRTHVAAWNFAGSGIGDPTGVDCLWMSRLVVISLMSAWPSLIPLPATSRSTMATKASSLRWVNSYPPPPPSFPHNACSSNVVLISIDDLIIPDNACHYVDRSIIWSFLLWDWLSVVVEMVGEWGDLQPRSSEENHEKARLSHPERLRSHCPSGKLQLLHDVQPQNEKT